MKRLFDHFAGETLMPRFTAVASLAAVAFASACASPDGMSSVSLAPSHARHSTFSADASPNPQDTLHVVIGGVGLVKSPSTQRYSAQISNSTATRFMYQWFEADCLSTCPSTPVWELTEGEGLNVIYSGFASTTDYRIFTVHVTELDGAGRSGSARFETQGPDIWTSTDGGYIYDNPCDAYTDIYYPLNGTYTDTTGQSRPRQFRRNYCNNATSWDPGT